MNLNQFAYGDFKSSSRYYLQDLIVFNPDIAKNASTNEKIQQIQSLMMNRNQEFFPGLEYIHKVSYTGQYENGLADGFGTLYVPNLFEYKGEFKNGRVNGQGELYYIPRMTHINGCFDSGKLHGIEGSFYQNEETYEGKPSETIPSDWVTISCPGVYEYRGQIKNYKFEGKGKLKLKNNGSYSGEFLNGKAHGLGIRTLQNGDKFKGEFAFSKPHSTGRYYFSKEKKWFTARFTNGFPDLVDEYINLNSVFDPTGVLNVELD